MAQGADDVATALDDLRERTCKTVCTSWVFAPRSGSEILARAGMQIFSDPAQAIETLGHAARFVPERERADASIDDVTLTRAPFDPLRAHDVLRHLRIVQRAGSIDPAVSIAPVAAFVARFSQLAASAPWRRFVLEVNPIKWHAGAVSAVDGLLLIEAV